MTHPLNLTRPVAATERNHRRRYWQHQRDAISVADRALGTEQIATHLEQKLTQLLTQRQVGTLVIGVYWPIRSEPDLLRLWEKWQDKHQLALPKVLRPDSPLRFLRWDRGASLVREPYGAQVPQEQEHTTTLAVDPDLLIVPCVAWNIVRGGVLRLGYGGGFYDRSLGLRPCLSWGVSFDALEDSSLEPAAHDCLLDAIVTPQRR